MDILEGLAMSGFNTLLLHRSGQRLGKQCTGRFSLEQGYIQIVRPSPQGIRGRGNHFSSAD